MTWKDIAILGLLAFIIYLVFFKKDPAPIETHVTQQHYDSIRMYQDSLVIVQESARQKRDSINQLKAIAKRSQDRYLNSIATARRNEIQARQEIQTMIDTIPKLKAYIALRDSTDRLYQARIDTLEEENRIQGMVYEDLIKDKDAETAIGKSILRNAYAIIEEKDKQIFREKRKTFRAIVLGILGIAGTAIITKEIAD